MLRALGGGLILCAALLTRQTLLRERRAMQRTRRALAGAFEAMEAEIRALLTPLPALLRRSYGAETEPFFAALAAALRRGTPVEEAWRAALEALPLPEEERASLAPLGARLGGDEEGVRAALALAARTLRASYEDAERRRAQDERLTTALCLGAGLLLAILLI